ncbi:MAG: hypothetical protein GKS06_11745 [Acidobacteria bacterium]|nr:hypothetical protein [Acidobacteriota bacterium]
MKNLFALALSGVVILMAQSPDQDALRLRQEFDSLKFQFNYETDRLERRIETLERELARIPPASPLRPSQPAPILVPTPSADEIAVRRLVVTDDEGRIRGVLAVSEIYGPMLGLLNEHGDVVGLFAAGDAGTTLEIYDDAAGQRALLGLVEDEATLQLRDAEGNTSVRVPAAETGRQ